MRVLTVNPGSSSLKLAVVDDGTRAAITRHGDAGGPGEVAARVRDLVAEVPGVDAAAVRVVHAGATVTSPTLVDGTVRAALAAAVPLAPLHNPPALAAVDALGAAAPGLPVVAVPDHGFHRHLPEGARHYALPAEWAETHGLLRYGFHGLSHAWAAARAAALLERPLVGLRLVTAHLGAGASLAAVVDGVSADTTMGFTPLEGLVMATRSGSVDPGLLLHALEQLGLGVAELREMLEHRSGLAGLSGRSGDLREVLAGAEAGDERCRRALAVYEQRLVTGIGAMVAAAGGLDALVFTGGVGEGSAWVRRRVAVRLGFLGLALGAANEHPPGPDTDLSAPGAAVRTLVVTAREDLQLAREAEAVLTAGAP